MVLKFRCDYMSKVILLNASPRVNSNTKIVLEECAREIEKEGVETEIISLKGMKVQSCIACLKCVETGNCVLPDGLDEIIEKIRNADGFIPAAPVYFGTARGDIMAALQRIGKVSRGGDKFLDWMVGGPIAVARRGGVTLTLQEMMMFFAINNMIVAGSTYWNMVIAGAEGTALEDEEGIETIRLFGQNVAKIIKKVRD
jgi:multimeric flavodoxin WrbA